MRISKRFLLTIVLSIAMPCVSFAQATSTGVPFLTVPASVESHSIGRISTLPLDGALGLRSNPSIPAVQAFEISAQGAFYAPATDWLPGFGAPITFSAQGLQLGFRLDSDGDSHWAVGVGYERSFLDLGTFAYTLNDPTPVSTFHGWEEVNAFSCGLAYAGAVTIGAGAAVSLVRSNLAPFGTANETTVPSARATTWSLGTTLRVPVSRLLGIEEPIAGLTPFAAISTSLVISDLGSSIRYQDMTQGDPLPRAATIGVSASAGLRGKFADQVVCLLELEILREAQDILVERTYVLGPEWKYQKGLGDLRPLADVFGQSGNTAVEHRKGFRASFAETFTYSEGLFVDGGYSSVRTSGLRFSSRALFLILHSMMAGDGTLSWIFGHTGIGFAQSSYEAPRGHPLDGTTFQSFTITLYATSPHASL